jgi:ubiquinone/menaquinone biosynthesis C-methylase UbiE
LIAGFAPLIYRFAFEGWRERETINQCNATKLVFRRLFELRYTLVRSQGILSPTEGKLMASASTATPALNYWPNNKCAKAFWGQHELPPYQKLLAATIAWLDPRPGEKWLDLGCGSGQLTRGIWEKSAGQVEQIVSVDCAAANEKSIARLSDVVQPRPEPERLQFVQGDFSLGLSSWPDHSFDGATSGLAIQYAESYSVELGQWTTAAYDHLLSEVFRVLRPGGRFVFSVNFPNPSWWIVALTAVHGFFVARKPTRYLKNSLRMLRYGSWLKKEARHGRFHYLPLETVLGKLASAGFPHVEHTTSFGAQAYLFRCHKP